MPESSGVDSSSQYPGVYWMIGDSGTGNYLYAVSETGQRIKRFTVSGVSNDDWEDIALDSNNIWIAETGDNDQNNAEYKVYKIAEPDPYGTATTVSPIVFRFVYPDGYKDCEGMFVWQGVPFFFQKRPTNARLYGFPGAPSGTGLTTLSFIGEFANSNYWITGAGISSDGRRLALVSDQGDTERHWVLERPIGSTSIVDFFGSSKWEFEYENGQEEAICFKKEAGKEYDVVSVNEVSSMKGVPRGLYEGNIVTSAQTSPSDAASTPEGSITFGCSATATQGLSRIELHMADLSGELVPKDSMWRYDDTNTDFLSAWTSLSYDDSQWKTGQAYLGFGDAKEALALKTSVISGTPRIPTYYFRKKFNSDGGLDNAVFWIDYDDGFIMYLNGNPITDSGNVNNLHSQYSTSAHNWAGDDSPGSPKTYPLTATDLSRLQSGENVIAIELHQSSSTSTDIMMNAYLYSGSGYEQKSSRSVSGSAASADFDLATAPGTYRWKCRAVDSTGREEDSSERIVTVTAVSGDAEFTIAPKAMFGTQESIMFETNIPVKYRIDYGLSDTYGSSVSSSQFKTYNEAFLDGLLKGAKYEYRVTAESQAGSAKTFQGSFETLDPKKSQFRFAVIGDRPETGPIIPSEYTKILGLVNGHNPDFILYMGDVAVLSSSTSRSDAVQKWAGFLQASASYTGPYFATTGNHDETDQAEGLIRWREIFQHPHNGPTDELIYSFRYGNSQFISLDCHSYNGDITGTQYDWLMGKLDEPGYVHRFVFCHRPLLGSPRAGTLEADNPAKALQLDGIFMDKGVSAGFYGHEHWYCYKKVSEVIHVTSGGGGADIKTGACTGSVTKNMYHFLIVDIDNNRMDAVAYDDSNNPIHSFSRTMPCDERVKPYCDGCIGDPELMDYVARWKSDSSQVPMEYLLSALFTWKDNGDCAIS